MHLLLSQCAGIGLRLQSFHVLLPLVCSADTPAGGVTSASGPTPTPSPAPTAVAGACGAAAAAAAAAATAAAGMAGQGPVLSQMGGSRLPGLPGGDAAAVMQRVQAAEEQAQAVLVSCSMDARLIDASCSAACTLCQSPTGL